jgi:uncharacterized protein (TIGR02453 family)
VFIFSNKSIAMLHINTLSFLKKLKANNHKDWMDANKPAYIAAKEDFEKFTADMLLILGKSNPDVAVLKTKDCTFRINRDVRFSQNKAPYKANMSWYIAKGGKKSPFAGYYCHIEPGQSFFASGVWMPMPEVLKNIRQEIDYNFKDVKKILAQKKFKDTFGDLDRSEGSTLIRPPKGYEADNPAVEYLKLKSFIVSMKLDEKQLTAPGLVEYVAGLCTTARPFIDFLNMAVENPEE